MNTVNLPRKPAMKAVQLENFRGERRSAAGGGSSDARSRGVRGEEARRREPNPNRARPDEREDGRNDV
ncbi:MAG: hypothetical protein VB082_02995 [Christensenella sp.]|nr:hypothetical protein [Christensenella sp.]